MIAFETVPARILSGQRTMKGTRNPPSHPVFFSLRKRGHRAIGPGVHVRAVVRPVNDDRIFGDAELIELIEDGPDVLVMVDHRVVVGRLVLPGLAEALRLGVRPQVHVREVDPHEEGLVVRRSGGG